MTVQANAKSDERMEDYEKKEAEDLAQLLSQKYGLPYLDLSMFSINTDALKQIPEKQAREANVAAFKINGVQLEIGVLSPGNASLKELMDELGRKGFKVTTYMVSENSLKRAWEFYKEVSKAAETRSGLVDISKEELEHTVEKVKNIEILKQSVKELLDSNKGQGVSRILEVVLAGAVAIGVSDIHLEAAEESARLRYRLDGVLQDVAEISPAAYKLVTSRIKLISALKLNVKDAPQDGRFSIDFGDREIEVRTSVLPGAYGETIVMRLLDPRSINVTVDQLGVEPYLKDLFEKQIEKPNGMILITGPTGSGKTTTLYAFLKKVNEPGIKIITIEDPIEYHLKGVTQTNVKEDKGYTFLEGLRSALRQDPDIIMVGEIRDNPTATTATNAALTGHLVFSTLHTNNAAGAFPRLIDLGVNPKTMGSSISVSIAQRLVRKLCQKCRKERPATEAEKALIEKNLSTIVNKTVEIPTKRDVVYEAVGCEFCNKTGYKGRLGIFEAILMDKAIEDLIQQNPSEREIEKTARAQGILNMAEDGVLKVARGITTLDELRRVIEID